MSRFTPRKPYRPTAEELARGASPIQSTKSPKGYELVIGMEVTLPKRPGRRKGRYEILKMEQEPSGKVVLTVYGPLSKPSPSRYYINPDDILVTHISTKGRK